MRASNSDGKRILILSLLLSGGFTGASGQRLPLAVFDAEHGLPSAGALTSKVDSRGLLWVGTSWGLSRLEGPTFQTFSLGSGLPSAVVRVIQEDARGELWLGTNRGLARYDGKQILAVPIPQLQGPPPLVWAGTRDRVGRLWFGTERGLVRVGADGVPAVVAWPSGTENPAVYSLLASGEQLVVGGRDGSFARCQISKSGTLESCDRWGPEAIAENGGIRDLAVDGSGRLFLATRRRGVWVLEGGLLQPIRFAAEAANDAYALLVREEQRELWIGLSRGGIALCSLDRLELCFVRSDRNGLPSNQIRHLEAGPDGSVWISTDSGLVRWFPEPLYVYSKADGLPDSTVLSVLANEDASVWVGTARGLSRLRPGPHGEARVEAADLPDARGVYALVKDRKGVLWVGSEAGLCALKPGWTRCEHEALPEELRRAYVLSLAVGPAGELWIGTASGLFRYEPEKPAAASELKWFGMDSGLQGEAVYSLALDTSGRLWAAHREALSWQRDGERFDGWTAQEQPLLGFVRSVARTGDGTLWIGGEGFLARYLGMVDGKPRFERLDLGPELGNRAVIGILDAGQSGWLLLGTNKGVLLMDPAARRGRGGVLALWDQGSGLPSSDLAHSSSLARDAAGGFWLGLHRGLVHFLRLQFAQEGEPPALEFLELTLPTGQRFRAPFSAVGDPEGIWLEGREVPLPADARSIRVRVAPRGWTENRRVSYQFRLRGVEPDWSSPSAVPFREYVQLPPGRVVLEARAVSGSAQAGPVAALQLFVTPFWWERTFVRLAGLLGLVTLLAAGMARRERVQRQRAEELSRAVADRTEDMVRYTRALSDHLAVLNRDLEHRRLQEKRQSDLLLRLAHDVRSPLTSLLGFSELLASSASSRLTARELRYLTNLTESAKQVLRLADDLLLEAELAAKGRSLQVEAVEVESLLGGVVSLLEGLAVSREISVRLEVAPNLPLVRTDLVLLRQVLLNLVSNAIKFSPNRAVVEVVADPDPASQGFWRIEVRDRGPGIPASEKKAVFDRFWRSPAAGGVPGHGLGLTIARELTERLGGQVEIEDRPGGGTILRLRLPLELSTESGQSPLAVEPAPSTSRVVVFDPSAERFFRWVPTLDRAGFLAVRTDDVEVLRQRLRELSPLAVVWVANPREPNLWALLEPAARDLSRQNLPFVHVVGEPRGERGFVLPWDRIFPPGTTREAIERALACPLDKVTLVGQQELELLTLSELESRLETTGSLRCLLLPDESLARQRERWWEEVAQAPEGLPTRLLEVLESFRRRAVAQNAKRGGISP